MSNWCALLSYRVKTNILDTLAAEQQGNRDFRQKARQIVDVCKQSSIVRFVACLDMKRSITQNTEKATAIVKEVLAFRKKTKDCYAKKQPTPLSFWDSTFKTVFPVMNETGPSSIMLHEQISGFIDQGIQKFDAELLKGIVPEKFYDGIQFYLNYILRVIHIQIPDEDIMKGTRCQANQIDALSEYSIGNIMSVMKLVFFMLYNPTTGVMIEDKEHCRNESIE